ncbi:hypothetical protein J0X19_14535 [Hymenobacter sp. BT186]|uniref:Uncharacterized protein n=1 Tax=Hymenobacter telluris TaxID=2816474 RepID=A0A939EX83_9BACT|nr:hypothetical protein [Hymenobacter telluris]MBO0359175.1 hypothetical protein [Hymenobacter telluris]MBW3375201.1 hypothetical protein [Hymenobacter norwichensis]
MRKTTTRQNTPAPATTRRPLAVKSTEEQFMAYFQEKLQGVYCPIHGSIPEIKLVPEPGGYSVDLLNDCCPAFTALCAKKIQ